MRVPGGEHLRAAGRWTRSRLRNRALILGYHRIASPASDPFDLCVSRESFVGHLEELRKSYKPVSLSRLVGGVTAGEIEHGWVALTFDDAYRETLHVAAPILAKYDIPATVFVTTSTLGQELWWDRLHRVFVASHPRLESGLDPDAAQRPKKLFMDLYRRLLIASPGNRKKALDQMEEEARGGVSETRKSRVVSIEELAALAGSPQIHIGSHTVSHPMMALLSREEQELEVAPSRSFLQNLLRREVTLFSYPNGSFSRVSEDVVREAGFAAACCSQTDVVTNTSNPFRLPRFWPSGSAESLKRTLELWLGG